jgi:hypothetical protein
MSSVANTLKSIVYYFSLAVERMFSGWVVSTRHSSENLTHARMSNS